MNAVTELREGQEVGKAHEPHLPIPIHIDGKLYKAPKTPMTGAELRALPEPEVPADRDLWLEMHGQADDKKVLPPDSLDLKPGMHLYTAPGTINPGRR